MPVMPLTPDRPTARSRLPLVLAIAFPVLLWIISSGPLLGFDLGKYSDDYALNLHPPESQSAALSHTPWTRWNYFWRPLHLASVYGLATVFWNHDWINHAISALAHALSALALFRFLRRLHFELAPASAAAALFIASPIAIEAVLWPAALGSVVSLGLLLVMLERWLTWLNAAAALPTPAAAPSAWSRAAVLFACTFAVACWHEQAAACVLAMPILALAVRPPAIALGTQLTRAGLATLAAGLGAVLYASLLLFTIPTGRRGSPATLALDPDAVNDRLPTFFRAAFDHLLGPAARDRALDGLELGFNTLSAPAIAALAVAIALALAFIGCCGRPAGAQASSMTAAHPPRLLHLALFALALIVASLLPVALVRNNAIFPRYMYISTAALAMLIACGLSTPLRMRLFALPRAALLFRAALFALTAALAMALALSSLGWQQAFRSRARADADQMRQLIALVPNPPPNAVFIPLSIADAQGFPARRRRNPGVLGGLAHPWACWAYIQRGYHRSDLSATHLRTPSPPPITRDAEGFLSPRGLTDALGVTNTGNTRIPFDRAVIFRVNADGTVVLEH